MVRYPFAGDACEAKVTARRHASMIRFLAISFLFIGGDVEERATGEEANQVELGVTLPDRSALADSGCILTRRMPPGSMVPGRN